jgi:hypothetical protein
MSAGQSWSNCRLSINKIGAPLQYRAPASRTEGGASRKLPLADARYCYNELWINKNNPIRN